MGDDRFDVGDDSNDMHYIVTLVPGPRLQRLALSKVEGVEGSTLPELRWYRGQRCAPPEVDGVKGSASPQLRGQRGERCAVREEQRMQVGTKPYLSRQRGEVLALGEVERAEGTAQQGLTLVPVSAQRKHIVLDELGS